MWFCWKQGRQETGYRKMTLFSFLFVDLYLLKYPTGTFINPHVDCVDNWKHYRLNIVLNKAVGGEFICPNAFFNYSRIKFFRPDIHEHSVSMITSGVRFVLSLGWVVPKIDN